MKQLKILKDKIVFLSKDRSPERIITTGKSQNEFEFIEKRFRLAVANAETVIYKKSEAIVIER